MAEVLIPRRTINKQEYVLLADIIVGTATTSVDISGLNIGKDEEIVLVTNFKSNTASSGNVNLFSNNNTTATNYYRQYLIGTSTTVVGGRNNDASIFDIPNTVGLNNCAITSIKLTNNGYIVTQTSNAQKAGTSSIEMFNFYTTSTFTATSITRLTITATVSNAIGVGSRFQLYRSAK